jgi:hypothetical protein
VAGALLSTLHQLIFLWRFPQFEPSQRVSAHPNVVIDILWQISLLPGKFEVVCILAVVFTVLAVYRYRRPGAWIYAFLAGRRYRVFCFIGYDRA